MPKPGPRNTYRYSDEFKATAVKLSQLPGVRVNKPAGNPLFHSDRGVESMAIDSETGCYALVSSNQ